MNVEQQLDRLTAYRKEMEGHNINIDFIKFIASENPDLNIKQALEAEAQQVKKINDKIILLIESIKPAITLVS